MNAKQFKTVEEWLNSNPSKEVIEKVLKVANKSVISEIRKEFKEKRSELSKTQNAIKSMERVQLPITKEITEKVKTLQKEVEDLKSQLPVVKQKTKKSQPKKDVQKEEQKVEELKK